MERVTRKIVQYLEEKNADKTAITKRFKKRSRNRQEWYTKICIKARHQQR